MIHAHSRLAAVSLFVLVLVSVDARYDTHAVYAPCLPFPAQDPDSQDSRPQTLRLPYSILLAVSPVVVVVSVFPCVPPIAPSCHRSRPASTRTRILRTRSTHLTAPWILPVCSWLLASGHWHLLHVA